MAEAIGGRPRAEILAPRGFSGAEKIRNLARGAWRGKSRKGIRGTGYVVDALEAALWCVATSSDFRGAVLRAANLREDADTTAAIAGAIYGLNAIPSEWLDRLAWRDRLEKISRKLVVYPQAGLLEDVPVELSPTPNQQAASSLNCADVPVQDDLADGVPLPRGWFQKGEFTDRQRLEALARYARIFGPGFKYGEWSDLHTSPRRSQTRTFEVAPEVKQFQEAMYDVGWVQNFAWAPWSHTPEGRALIEGGAAVDHATVTQLAKLITARLRLARFQEEIIIPEDIVEGLVPRIARRAEQILKELGDGAAAGAAAEGSSMSSRSSKEAGTKSKNIDDVRDA